MTLDPMAGATASGRFAANPIMTQPKIAAMAVPITSSPRSMPACDMIAGLTAMMYAMAANVVAPAMISCFADEPRSDRRK